MKSILQLHCKKTLFYNQSLPALQSITLLCFGFSELAGDHYLVTTFFHLHLTSLETVETLHWPDLTSKY